MTKEETEVLRAILEATTPLSNAKHGTKAGRTAFLAIENVAAAALIAAGKATLHEREGRTVPSCLGAVLYELQGMDSDIHSAMEDTVEIAGINVSSFWDEHL